MFDWADQTTMTYVVAFLTTTLMAYGVIELIMSLRHRDYKRIQRRLEDDWGRALGKSGKSADVIKDLTRDQKWAMARWLAASKRGVSFRKICDQAALPWPAHHIVVAICFGVIAFVVGGIFLDVHLLTLITGVVVIAVTPFLIVVILRNRRVKRFNHQMPEAFELLSQALRAGHALPAGVQLVAEQIPDPLGTEFSRVNAEQDLGIPMEEALEHMADRVDLLDLRMFVTAVQIQRQTGGDLTEMMDRIGAVIRDRIRILGQVRALTAEGRLSGWILTLLPFAVLFVLFQLNPSHPEKLFAHKVGHLMIGVALLMQITGMLIIRKIVNIKV